MVSYFSKKFLISTKDVFCDTNCFAWRQIELGNIGTNTEYQDVWKQIELRKVGTSTIYKIVYSVHKTF